MADANPSPTFPKGPFRSIPAPGLPPTQRDSTSGIDPAKIRRMNLNESPFPPSPRAIAAMQEAAARVNDTNAILFGSSRLPASPTRSRASVVFPVPGGP